MMQRSQREAERWFQQAEKDMEAAESIRRDKHYNLVCFGPESGDKSPHSKLPRW